MSVRNANVAMPREGKARPYTCNIYIVGAKYNMFKSALNIAIGMKCSRHERIAIRNGESIIFAITATYLTIIIVYGKLVEVILVPPYKASPIQIF
jgi:hypothetical protein